jgi:hypothetical protein
MWFSAESISENCTPHACTLPRLAQPLSSVFRSKGPSSVPKHLNISMILVIILFSILYLLGYWVLVLAKCSLISLSSPLSAPQKPEVTAIASDLQLPPIRSRRVVPILIPIFLRSNNSPTVIARSGILIFHSGVASSHSICRTSIRVSRSLYNVQSSSYGTCKSGGSQYGWCRMQVVGEMRQEFLMVLSWIFFELVPGTRLLTNNNKHTRRAECFCILPHIPQRTRQARS